MTRIGPDWFELQSHAPLANGDGLTYLHKRTVMGIQANTVQRREAAHWRVFPNEPLASLSGLRVGMDISRNRDQVWEQSLGKPSAERRIDLSAVFRESEDGFVLALCDADGITTSASLTIEKQPAKSPETAETALREQLDRFGNTLFALTDCQVVWQRPWFVPGSAINRLRREAVAQLEAARLAAHVRLPRCPAVSPPAAYPETSLSYLANVYNQAARAFYARHGVTFIAAAYEAHAEPGEVSLMITRHCLRHAFSLCPKQAKGVTGVQGQVRADPMTLVNGNERLTLKFDCRACEMHVMGRMKKHVLKMPPPGTGHDPC